MAKLIFNYAAMNSGKSIDLLRTVYNYEENGLKVLVMKPSIDTKGGDSIVTRAGLSRKVDFLISSGSNIIEMISDSINGVSCIFIDEAQFLSEQQVIDLFIISNNYDVPVICYGLRTDFKGNSFPGARRLLEIAHQLTEVKTICECGKKAMFNVRLIDGKVQTEGDSVAIDGDGKVTYTVACARCFRLKTHRKFYNKK